MNEKKRELTIVLFSIQTIHDPSHSVLLSGLFWIILLETLHDKLHLLQIYAYVGTQQYFIWFQISESDSIW